MLLYGHEKNAYWYGSQLSIDETRELAPYQNATGLQVTSAVLAGMVWALENPKAGIVEADEMDFRRCLEVQTPYLGPVIGNYTDWTPLAGRPGLFPEDDRQAATPGSSRTCWWAEFSCGGPERNGGRESARRLHLSAALRAQTLAAICNAARLWQRQHARGQRLAARLRLTICRRDETFVSNS